MTTYFGVLYILMMCHVSDKCPVCAQIKHLSGHYLQRASVFICLLPQVDSGLCAVLWTQTVCVNKVRKHCICTQNESRQHNRHVNSE